MSQEPFALSTIPPQPPAEGDYETICAAVRASARGRWFLDEYARRNRNADTEVVLAAIERVAAATRAGRDREAYQSVRGDLLEMARTIAVTRAEVAESRAEVREQGAPAPDPPAPAASEVFAMAGRIQDVAWTMRERGIDPRTCEQIETLAATILSASSLRDPNDRRARKLGEVLRYLEQRIDGMLDSCATEAQQTSQASDVPIVEAETSAPPAGNGHDVPRGHDIVAAAPVTATAPFEDSAAQPFGPFGSDDPTEVAAALGIDATVAGQADEEPPASEPLAVAVGRSSTVELAGPAAATDAAAAVEIESRAPPDALAEPVAVEAAPGELTAEQTLVEPPVAMTEDVTPTARLSPAFERAPQPANPSTARQEAEMKQATPPREDPLAALKALSDAERIALFT
jgi:hypothetical protein